MNMWPFGKDNKPKPKKDFKLELMFAHVQDGFENYMRMLHQYKSAGMGAQFTELPIKLCENEIEFMNARKNLEEYLLKMNITNPVLFQTFHPDAVNYPRLQEELYYEDSEDEDT